MVVLHMKHRRVVLRPDDLWACLREIMSQRTLSGEDSVTPLHLLQEGEIVVKISLSFEAAILFKGLCDSSIA